MSDKPTNETLENITEELRLETLYDVPVDVTVVLGKTSMSLNRVLKLTKGSVIELDRMVGEAIDIFINDKIVAKGEIVIVDNKVGVTLTEILTRN